MDQRPFISREIDAFFNRFCKSLSYGEPVTVFGPDLSRWSWLLPYYRCSPHSEQKKLYFVIIDLNTVTDDELAAIADKLNVSDKNQIIAIIGADEQVLKGENVVVHQIIRFANAKNLRYAFFCHKNILYPQFSPHLGSLYAEFTQNILYFPLSEEGESIEFMHYLCHKFDLTISDALMRSIYRDCGGYFWLMKQCMRLIRDGIDISRNRLEQPELNLKISHIYSQFNIKEKELLQKLPCRMSDLDEYKDEITYLSKIKWIEIKKTKVVNRVKLLEAYITSLGSNDKITLSAQGTILIHKTPLDTLFSANEQKLLRVFLQNKEKLYSKDEIAKILWGKNWHEKYSDWAIDQQVSRLRRKLKKLGLKENPVSVKGKGLMFKK